MHPERHNTDSGDSHRTVPGDRHISGLNGRIILTAHYSPWSSYSGGGQRSVHNLATEFSRRHKDVHVIYSKSPLERIPVPENLPYTVHWALLPALRSRRALFLRPLTALSVLRIVRRLAVQASQPVIVHANGEEAALLGYLRKSISFSLIATPRYSSYPTLLTSGRTLNLREKLTLALSGGKYLALATLLKEADRICPPSLWAAEEIRSIAGVNPDIIRVIPNGIPQEFLSYHWKPDPDNAPILFFGRLSRDKGIDILLKAYRMLPVNRPPLIIAGSGPDQKYLESLCRDLHLDREVRFTGWLTHDQLGKKLAGCRICILPSRVENYSLAILAAMAVGAPLITTRTGGNPELIRHGENGILTDPNDPEALYRSISTLLSKPDKAALMGSQAQREVRNTHTWNQVCNQFEEIYEACIRMNR